MQEDKNTAELLNKINKLKSRIEELEKSEAHCKKVKEELKEREIYQKTIFSAIQTGIVVIDAETQEIIDLNNVAAELIGVPKEEIIGHSCHKYICPAEEGKCPIIDLNQTVDHSQRILLDINANEIPIIKNVVPVNLGGREALLESFIDISEHRKAEKRLRSIIDGMVDLVFVFDKNGNFEYYNAPDVKELYLPPEKFLGIHYSEVMPEPVIELLDDALERNKNNEVGEYDYGLDMGGVTKYYSAKISPILIEDKYYGSVGVVRDVTEHKKAEKALRESEEKLRTVLESSPDAITVLDLEGKIMDCNQATVKLHEFSSKEELIGASVFELIAPGERQRAAEALKKSIEQGAMMNVEYMFFTKDGREFPAEASGSLISDETGKPTSLVAITRDITERKKAEQTLKESEERIRGIFESSPDSIQVTDLAGNLIECNNATLDLLGVSSKDEIIGKPVFEYIAPEHRQEVGQAMKMTIKKGLIKRFESVLIDKDGHKFPVEVSANVILDHSGKPTSFIATIKDITERKKAEEALKVSEEKYKGIVEKFLKVSNEIIIEISKK